MSYLDQRRLARSPATLIVVAALEAGVIYALVSGLAVKFFPPAPPPPTLGYQVDLPKPKPLPTPSASPSHSDPVLQRPQTPPPIPWAQPSAAPSPIPTGEPSPFASPSPAPSAAPSPDPAPGIAPRAARPLGRPATWVGTGDYPSRDLSDGNQGLVRFRLEIGTDGRVKGCMVTGSSGHPGLDKAACDLIARRARFEPASDSSGAKVPGSYTGSVRWMIPE